MTTIMERRWRNAKQAARGQRKATTWRALCKWAEVTHIKIEEFSTECKERGGCPYKYSALHQMAKFFELYGIAWPLEAITALDGEWPALG